MDYLIGIIIALIVCAFGTIAGFDKDRSFYPTILTVIASYYLLFAAMAGTRHVLALELIPFAIFVTIAVSGSRRWHWLVAFGLMAHGGFDLLHGRLIDNPGVPEWWPRFCFAFDFTAGFCLLYRLSRYNRQDSND
jgi:hypothetical protein